MTSFRHGRTSGAVRNYIGEAESWKVAHEEANACLDFEELLALGNSVFDAIDRWDTIWHRKVHVGEVPFDATQDQQILALYRLWLSPSLYLLDEIRRFEEMGYAISGAELFRSHCDDARGIVTPDDEFFGEELIRIEETAIAAHRLGDAVEFEEMGD